MKARTSASVAGMVVLALLCSLYMGKSGLRTSLGDDSTTARVELPDTNGLVEGARVLMRGIAIGDVVGVHTSAAGVDVTWRYYSGVAIAEDSTFRVDNLSALGEPYLSIRPESANGPYLTDGAVVSPTDVVSPTTFGQLSERLTNLLTQVDPDAVQEIFHTLDIALPDDPRVYGNISRAGEVLAAEMTDKSDRLTTLLATLQPLLRESAAIPAGLTGATPYVADFGIGFEKVISDGIYFAVEQGPLLSGIENGASPFISELQVFLDATAEDLNVIGVDLLPAVSAAARSVRGMDLGGLLNLAMAATESGDALTVRVNTIPPTGP